MLQYRVIEEIDFDKKSKFWIQQGFFIFWWDYYMGYDTDYELPTFGSVEIAVSKLKEYLKTEDEQNTKNIVIHNIQLIKEKK